MKPTKNQTKIVILTILLACLFYLTGMGTVAASYYVWFVNNTYFHVQVHILDALLLTTRICFGIGATFLLAIIGFFCTDIYKKKNKRKSKKKKR